MTRNARSRAAVSTLAVAVATTSIVATISASNRQQPTSTAAALKIVVVAGEDAVNIIQQQTAVAPIVEVRDRNDQPVAGAVVNFAIRGGRATFGGARTLTVATDIAGRAVASGLTPTASGALQISASAVFQGQTAAVTIAQTNVMTAAQAAAVSSASGASGSGAAASTGAASGGGGGLSATTIGLIGGAAAGATLVAVNAGASPAPPVTVSSSGSLNGQLVVTFTTSLPGRTNTCTHTRDVSGTLSLTLQQHADSTINGDAVATTVETGVAQVGCNAATTIGSVATNNWTLPVTGNAQSLAFTGQRLFTQPLVLGGSVQSSIAISFSGTLSGGVVTGTITLSRSGQGTSDADPANPGAPIVESGTTTFSVTLR